VGLYTTNLKFYKPDATEFVDPETQLNRNWDISDGAVRQLLEYEYSALSSPDVSDAVDRARFFKPYSNSVMAWFKSGPFFYQDPKAFVSPWVSAKGYLQLGWFEHPDFPLCYRIIKISGGSTAEIEWTGAVVTQYPNPTTIDVNINLTVVDAAGVALPVGVKPIVNKYFTTSSGNTSTNYSIGRLFFGSTGGVEFKRYGSDPTTPGDENRIEFTGIKYNVEVVGT
jgi:hypothetical protein